MLRLRCPLPARVAKLPPNREPYWINPGYELTSTQTADKSCFSVSQKIHLFALISLDENWPVRRRMLL